MAASVATMCVSKPEKSGMKSPLMAEPLTIIVCKSSLSTSRAIPSRWLLSSLTIAGSIGDRRWLIGRSDQGSYRGAG